MQPNPFSLKERKILVTGATSGIGAATAVACANAGADVIVSGRNTERLEEIKGRIPTNTMAIMADITDEQSLSILIEELPIVDGVVLCAGVNEVCPIRFATRKKIDAIFETNLFAQIDFLRLLIKKKKFSDNASVVAISSIGGNEVFSIGQAAYGASKAALLSWMKYAAKEMAPSGIRINCILPGHIETPMNDKLSFSAEQLESYKQTIPLKRFGQPDDIANGVVYLLSNASSWMTGTALKIDGGSTL